MDGRDRVKGRVDVGWGYDPDAPSSIVHFKPTSPLDWGQARMGVQSLGPFLRCVLVPQNSRWPNPARQAPMGGSGGDVQRSDSTSLGLVGSHGGGRGVPRASQCSFSHEGNSISPSAKPTEEVHLLQRSRRSSAMAMIDDASCARGSGRGGLSCACVADDDFFTPYNLRPPTSNSQESHRACMPKAHHIWWMLGGLVVVGWIGCSDALKRPPAITIASSNASRNQKPLTQLRPTSITTRT